MKMLNKKNKKEKKVITDPKDIEFVTEKLKTDSEEKKQNVKSSIIFVVLIAIIACALYGLYYVNGKFVTKDEFQSETTTTTTEATYDSSLLTINTMFNVSSDTYYVLIYNPNDDVNGSYYKKLVSSYSTSSNIKLYTVDYTNAMNKNYYNESGTANTSPKSASDVVITGTTLITFKGSKVKGYTTVKSEITSLLS
ncbi:MAG TPA: hypothetical protein PKG93_00185 [Bacilli bacterium]|nr:hypothetical protein [Bacilli bacterium]HPZ24267.1 hypothetical protein [Bacilli bacterium]